MVSKIKDNNDHNDLIEYYIKDIATIAVISFVFFAVNKDMISHETVDCFILFINI